MRVLGDTFAQQLGHQRSGAAAAAGSSLLDSLVACWKLEEANGTRVDATGRGNDLTPQGAVAQTVGKLGNAAAFNGSDQWLARASTNDLRINGSFTMAAWFRMVDAPSSAPMQMLFAKESGAGLEYRLYMACFGIGLAWEVGAAPPWEDEQPMPGALVALNVGYDNVWHFACAWYDAVNQEVGAQLDNGTPSTGSATVPLLQGTAPLQLGADTTLSYFLNGKLDSVAKWDRVLTAPERAALWNGGAGVEYPFS